MINRIEILYGNNIDSKIEYVDGINNLMKS